MKEYEEELYNKNINFVAGIDEAGRGPLYGPVVAACVVMPKDYFNPMVNDSKQLSEKKRELLFEEINEKALGVGVSVIDASRIDEINIYEATKEAMKESIEKCLKQVNIEYILIDAVKLDNLTIPSKSIIKGDCKSESIACASIIAKVTRDRLLKDLAKKYPEYKFEKNKGYGTKEHMEALRKYGSLKDHRRSFKPVMEVKEREKQK